MNDDHPPEFFTEAQLARRWGVHPSTVSRWISAGRLTVTRLTPGTVRVHRSAIEAFEAHAQETAA